MVLATSGGKRVKNPALIESKTRTEEKNHKKVNVAAEKRKEYWDRSGSG